MPRTKIWESLIHAGPMLPPEYQPKGLKIKIAGETIELTPQAEEMAYAIAKKKDTKYVQDPVFVENFMVDFRKVLPSRFASAKFSDIDFTEVNRSVERDRIIKETLTKEEKKRQAAERRRTREELKEKYGFAIIDGKKVEIGNWAVEPPGIFMGRAEAPLRGRWKPRVHSEDIVLNLSPDAPIPPGKWKEIVHRQDVAWLAKWRDPLTGREKNIWPHESSHIQQQRTKAKYDKARRVSAHIERIRERIRRAMESSDERERKVGTVCYLIDTFGLRVGDEKDENETETYGASTLPVSSVKFNPDGTIALNFLGKDSVPFFRVVESPNPTLVKNLKEFIGNKSGDAPIFDGIDSHSVNRFLKKAMPGLTAKIFRTYWGTRLAEASLEAAKPSSEEEKVYTGKLANLQAAVFLNHKRTPPKNYEETLAKKEAMLKEIRAKIAAEPDPEKRRKLEARMKKAELQLDLALKVRDYNLNTSLKNYIDPMVYKQWCDQVGLEYAKIYSKTLLRKFEWAFGKQKEKPIH